MNLCINIYTKLKSDLICRNRLGTEYGTSIDFSELWDRLQNEGRCCGIIGPDVSTQAIFPLDLFITIAAPQLNISLNYRTIR